MRSLLPVFFLPVVLALALVSCRSRDDVETVSIEDYGQEPDLVMTDFDYSASTNGVTSWEIRCKTAEKFDTLRRFLFRTITFRLYEQGSVRALLTAKTGTANYYDHNMTARSNVRIVFNDGTVLTTESLTWDDRREVLRTEDFVRIVKPDGDTVTGYGLTMDRNADEIVIKHRVKGKVNNDGTGPQGL